MPRRRKAPAVKAAVPHVRKHFGEHWTDNGRCAKCGVHFYHHDLAPCLPGQLTPTAPVPPEEDLI